MPFGCCTLLLAAESAQIDALAAQARLSLDAHLLWSID